MGYTLGYYEAASAGCSQELYTKLRQTAAQCGRFVVGVPSDSAMSYAYGIEGNGYAAETAREFWGSFPFVDEVLVLDADDLPYRSVYKRIGFDVCFYGSEYGRQFLADRDFFRDNKVDFLPLEVSPVEGGASSDALFPLLAACKASGIKIITFGSGAYFKRYMAKFGSSFKPVYTIDNASSAWGTVKDGVPVCAPEKLKDEEPAEVLIIICVKKHEKVVEQILGIKDFDYRTLEYAQESTCAENVPRIKSWVEENRQTLKRIQQINYDMLKEFDQVCTAHGIGYQVIFGTLIGAVRHKGFIPWDGDVDTIMRREDAEKLKLLKDEFSGDYYWLSPDSFGKRKYFDSVERVGYKNAYVKKYDGSAEFYLNYCNGIHLDIFFVDRTYDDFRGKKQRFELALLYGLMNAYRHSCFFAMYDKKMRRYNAVLRVLGRMIPLGFLRRRADKVARRFDADDKAPYYFISNCDLNRLGQLIPQDAIDKPAVRLPFEEMQVSASPEYDSVCRLLYGNYMQLPPLASRYPCFWGEIITSRLFVFEAPAWRGNPPR